MAKQSNYKFKWWENGIYGMIVAVCYVVSLMPMWLHYIFSDAVLFPLVYHLVGYRRKLVRKNLKDCFPEKSDAERLRIERDFYHFLCDYVVETLKLCSISPKEMQRRMVFRNMDYINGKLREGRSVSCYIGHYCNWEWITSIGMYIVPCAKAAQIYHVLENKYSDRLFQFLRGQFGNINVPTMETLRVMADFRSRKQPLVTGFISDQTPFWNNIHYWTDFFHHDTPVLTGAEKLSKRLDNVVVYMDMKRVKRGYYVVDVIPMVEHSKDIPDYELTEQYTRMLESIIKREPQYWLWTHNRWKRTREEYNRRYGVKD